MLASIFSVTIRWFSRIIAGLKNGFVCQSCWRIAIVDSEELQSSNAIEFAFQISNTAMGGADKVVGECFIKRMPIR